jgi:transcriptional regulator with PAS, ATPase and Fis domain
MEQFLEASKEADQQDGVVAIDLNGEIHAANKIIHSMLSNETQTPLKNLFHYDPKLREALSQSTVTSVSFSTKLKEGIHKGNNTYLVNCVPIFNNEKVHEGWIGRILQISSGSRTDGEMAAFPVLKENPSHPIYISSDMSKIVNRARKVASFASTKLILGESGVGKEVLAKFIHVNGPRAAQPFIALNCAAIPKELLASELFGYESGAFTGAKLKGKPGKFQQANHGTIYFDEVGDMPLDLQAYLLRVIEEKKVTRLGGMESIPIDVQIIASTNCDLKRLVKDGKFRLDLYYRLDVITLVIPPLRERKDDIRPLTEFFLEKVRGRLDGVKKRLSQEALDALQNYNWPGNIREMEHVIEMAHAISNGDIITPADLREDIFHNTFCWRENLVSGNQTKMEDEEIKMTIKICDGNMSKAAKTLHISRTTLYRKIMKYGIPLKVNAVDYHCAAEGEGNMGSVNLAV